MGLLSLLNVSCNAQIQYWGEDTYDLENVKFGINVDKYYSKAVDIKKKWKTSEKFDHSMRYYSKDTIECITKDGRKDTIYEYGSFETTHSDVLARFGDFKFPYTGMVADKKGGMIGIIARGYLKNTVEVDSLLLSLAAKYGYMCLFTKSLHDDKNFAWRTNDRTIQLYVKAPNEGIVRTVLYYEEDEKGNHKLTGSGKRLDTSCEVSLFVTKTQYDPFLKQINMGEWCDFHCFDAESDSIYLRGAEKLITELDLVLDAETNYLTIPNGSMPRFPPNAYSDHPDFAYMIYNWLENHAHDGVEETAHGDCDVSFTIDKHGKVKDIKVEKVHFGASGDLKTAVINAIKRLPQFIPATQNGKPVSFRITTSISF